MTITPRVCRKMTLLKSISSEIPQRDPISKTKKKMMAIPKPMALNMTLPRKVENVSNNIVATDSMSLVAATVPKREKIHHENGQKGVLVDP